MHLRGDSLSVESCWGVGGRIGPGAAIWPLWPCGLSGLSGLLASLASCAVLSRAPYWAMVDALHPCWPRHGPAKIIAKRPWFCGVRPPPHHKRVGTARAVLAKSVKTYGFIRSRGPVGGVAHAVRWPSTVSLPDRASRRDPATHRANGTSRQASKQHRGPSTISGLRFIHGTRPGSPR